MKPPEQPPLPGMERSFPIKKTGIQLKEDGVRRVLTNQTIEWKERAKDLYRYVAQNRRTFTADTIRVMAAELGLEEPAHPNAWSAMARWALSEKITRNTYQMEKSSRPERHDGWNWIWESLIF